MCVIWQHYPCNMYIHLHTIGLTGATELGTVPCHFVPNQRRFQWSISRWILLCWSNIFGKKFKAELTFICAEFQIFSTSNKHYITILVIISHGNRQFGQNRNQFRTWYWRIFRNRMTVVLQIDNLAKNKINFGHDIDQFLENVLLWITSQKDSCSLKNLYMNEILYGSCLRCISNGFQIFLPDQIMTVFSGVGLLL